MSCKICGRSGCTESFHSIAEQEAHERYCDLSEYELRAELSDRDDEILNLKKELEDERENDERDE